MSSGYPIYHHEDKSYSALQLKMKPVAGHFPEDDPVSVSCILAKVFGLKCSVLNSLPRSVSFYLFILNYRDCPTISGREINLQTFYAETWNFSVQSDGLEIWLQASLFVKDILLSMWRRKKRKEEQFQYAVQELNSAQSVPLRGAAALGFLMCRGLPSASAGYSLTDRSTMIRLQLCWFHPCAQFMGHEKGWWAGEKRREKDRDYIMFRHESRAPTKAQ